MRRTAPTLSTVPHSFQISITEISTIFAAYLNELLASRMKRMKVRKEYWMVWLITRALNASADEEDAHLLTGAILRFVTAKNVVSVG
jgi:hypothetical protein